MLLLFFLFIISVISSFVSIRSLPPSRIVTWTQSSQVPKARNQVVPVLGRGREMELTSYASLNVSVSKEVTGSERLDSVSCNGLVCVGATGEGSVLSWGSPNGNVLGRTDIRGNEYAQAGVVHQLLDGVFITQVSVLSNYPFEDTRKTIVTAISRTGQMFIWGSDYRTMITYSDASVYWKLLSNKGGIGLALSSKNEVYSWSVDASSFFLGRAGNSTVPNLVEFPSAIDPVSQIFAASRYAIVATTSLDNKVCILHTWGSGLELSVLPSNRRPLVYNFTGQIQRIFPLDNHSPCVHKIDGSESGILVAENDCNCLANTTSCVRSSRLFYISLNKGTILNKENWMLLNSPTISSGIYSMISVGLLVTLVRDSNGVVFSFNYESGRFLEDCSINQIKFPQGSDISLLFSFQTQITSLVAPTVYIHPRYSASSCGISSFNCPTLSLALSRYTMTGTTFYFESGLHYDSNAFSSVDDIRIRSLGGLNSMILDCKNSACLNLTGSGIEVSDIAFKNGAGIEGGCLSISGTHVKILNSKFESCVAVGDKSFGGAIYFAPDSLSLLQNTSFHNNSASFGGSVYINTARLNISGCNFSFGTATFGGAVMSQSALELIVSNSYIFNNIAIKGGGISSSNSNITVAYSEVRMNDAVSGGGIHLEKSNFTLFSSILKLNIASASGAGLLVDSSYSVIYNSSFITNMAKGTAQSSGGALLCLGNRVVSISESVFLNNNSTGNGGAISTSFCRPTITLSNFSSNLASFAGGAIFVGLKGSVKVDRSILEKNVATFGAGISFQYSSISTILNSSFYSNNAAYHGTNFISRGGGIHSVGILTVHLEDVIFNSNLAAAGGGFWWDTVAPVEKNVSFISNHAFQGPDKASEVNSLVLVSSLDLSKPVESGNLTKMDLVVNLLDFYHQVVKVESSVDLILKSTDTDTSFYGNLTSRLTNGTALFDSWGITKLPNSVAKFRVEGYFSSRGTMHTVEIVLRTRACKAGEFIESGIKCSICTPGSYSPKEMTPSCLECPAGTFQEEFGMSFCKECPLGKFANHNKSSECLSCSPGSFSNITGTIECKTCRPGFFAESKGQSECIACPEGFYSSQTSQSKCLPCLAGKYSNSTGSIMCESCPRGTYQSIPAQSFCSKCIERVANCSICGPGTTSSLVTESTSCIRCPPGTYATSTGECIACPARSSFSFVSGLCECWPTFYYDLVGADLTATCVKCPQGANCTSAGTKRSSVFPVQGYFPDISYSNITFIACVNKACNPFAGNGFCEIGYTGNVCTACAPGYGRIGMFDCEICPDGLSNKLKIFGLFTLFSLFVFFLVYSVVTQTRKEVQSVLIRIITNSIQFNAMVASVNISWPDATQFLIKMQRYTSELITTFISLDCFLTADLALSSPFYSKSVFVILLPLCSMLAPGLILYPKFLLESNIIKSQRENKKIDAIECSIQLEAKRRLMIRHYVVTIIVLLFLLYPTLASTTILFFTCKQIAPGESGWYLLGDLGEKCYTSRFYMYSIGIGIPSFIFYCLGIPVLFCYMLMYFKAVKSYQSDAWHLSFAINRKEICTVTSFLRSGYRPKVYFWEIVTMIRKTLIILVITYLNGYPNIQLLMGTLVIVIFLFLHLKIAPFCSKVMNRFETYSLVTSFVVFYLGQFILSDDVALSNKNGVGTFVFVWLLFFFLISVFFFFLIISRNQRRVAALETEKALGKTVIEDEEDDEATDDDVFIDISTVIQEKTTGFSPYFGTANIKSNCSTPKSKSYKARCTSDFNQKHGEDSPSMSVTKSPLGVLYQIN